jgi:hypothetical protein
MISRRELGPITRYLPGEHYRPFVYIAIPKRIQTRIAVISAVMTLGVCMIVIYAIGQSV